MFSSRVQSGLLFIGIVAVFWITYLAGLDGGPSPLEAALLQGIALAVSVIGSISLGRSSGQAHEEASLQRWARSTMRKVLVMAEGMVRMGTLIESEAALLADHEDGNNKVRIELASSALRVVGESLRQLAPLGGDVLEEFREVIPDYVKEVEEGAG